MESFKKLLSAGVFATIGFIISSPAALADVSLGAPIGTTTIGCTGLPGNPCIPPPPVKKPACNQGVGNGPEGCDPGNSNHNQPSNDENGGTPGNPGRKGSNR